MSDRAVVIERPDFTLRIWQPPEPGWEDAPACVAIAVRHSLATHTVLRVFRRVYSEIADGNQLILSTVSVEPVMGEHFTMHDQRVAKLEDIVAVDVELLRVVKERHRVVLKAIADA